MQSIIEELLNGHIFVQQRKGLHVLDPHLRTKKWLVTNVGYAFEQYNVVYELEIIEDNTSHQILVPQNATYSASKFKILRVYHLENESQQVKCIPLHYRQDDIVEVGSHAYYKNLEVAFFNCLYELSLIVNGVSGYHPYKKWYKNGVLQYECMMKNGFIDGIWREWNMDGRLHEECEYYNGKLDGTKITYYSCGSKRSQEKYVQGTQEGLTIYYDKNGKITEKTLYKNGDIVHTFNFDKDILPSK